MKRWLLAVFVMLLSSQGAFARKDMMKIKMTFDNSEIVLADLNDTKTAQDLYSKLPLTIKMQKHNSQEFYADIQLDKNGPTQSAYSIGDLAYWTPGNTFVIFYDVGSSYSIIPMGKIMQGLESLPKMPHTVSVHIEREK